MHKELVVNTPSLSGSSELLVIAPIKPGFVPALDAVTYTSRAKLLLRALHSGRKNAHEYNLFRAVSDAVERVGVIHTLRVAVLEPDEASKAGSILLSVNFDGAYEAYVRTIWQKAARLLDLIFCNTIDHVTGWDHSYDAWSRWLLSRQIDTPFYYGAPSLTKGDATALRMQDRFQRRQAGTDLLNTRTAFTDAEHIAWELIRNDRDPQSGPFAQGPSQAMAAGEREGVRQGLQGLAGVYRLADLYTPGTADGDVLRHAAYELLPEFVRMWQIPIKYGASIRDAAGERLSKALQWLEQPLPLPAVRQKPPLPSAAPTLPPRAQAGIMRAVEGATRACVCLVSFDAPADAAAFLREFTPTPEGAYVDGQDCCNVTLSLEGLRACGVPERVLDRLPIEFRQGMQRRAGVLGDVQANHPRRWALPVANWPAAVDHPDLPPPPGAPNVPLEAVHALLHVRVFATSEQKLGDELKVRFARLGTGVRPLSVQWLRRQFDNINNPVDHFGYSDGHSDPVFAPDNAFFFPNQVHVGEALVGHANAADASPQLGPELAPLLQDASYLVVRKLRQDVAAFDAAVAATGLPTDTVKAKLMGRNVDGTPLFPGGGMNDFNYDDDPAGSVCPFAAHIRRANPRVSDGVQANEVKALPGGRPPRLFRRGMSYMDSVDGGGVEKGLFFMAYNARIGEQFEIVQRWLAGGNSSGAPSGAADAICGVAEAGRRRFFRFENAGSIVHMPLDGDDELGVEAPPLVRLAWGAYFLAPSLDGVEHLATLADAAALANAGAAQAQVPWSVAEGLAAIKKIQDIEAEAGADAARAHWKTALEDPESRREFRTASIWAAIRRGHGGLLRTPYGVLVADDALVRQVLTDVDAHYTVDGYQQRLAHTIGPIFLGLDAGAEYDRQALACNGAIEQLTFDDGYTPARALTRALLQRWVDDADQRAGGYGESRWELNVDIRDVNDRVLAGLLEAWFGLSPAGGHLTPDGFSWAFAPNQPARYPGAFYTPSRYTFQPQPTDTVRDIAERHGQHLRDRMTRYLQASDTSIVAPVTRAVLDNPALLQPDGTRDYDLAARTIAGAIMGFVPTTDNNLRRVVEEWLRDQTIWDLRARTAADSLAAPANGRRLLADPIARTMMLRPMPEFIWRTSLEEHVLPTTDGGAFVVHAGDRVVLGLISATQQGLERGARDVVPVFGGDRWATPAPRHACPGMPSAMGVIAGVLSAIVDSPLALRPAVFNGLLSFEGPVSPAYRARPPAPIPASAERMVTGHGAGLAGGPRMFARAATSRGTLLGWGDSWFNLNHPLTTLDWDLARSLAELGWDTAGFSAYSDAGLTLREMAAVAPRTGFYRLVRQRMPRAILLDGGGNDVHERDRDPQGLWFPTSPLHHLAAPAGSTPPLNPQAVADFVHGQLRGRLDTVLANLVEATQGTIPILVHGYDHPIPDGSHFPFGAPWLDPVNDRSLYTLDQGRTVMRLLIDELNTMIAAAVVPFAARGARHLPLTGTLALQPEYGTNYRRWWLNELHPTKEGYDALAAVADIAITAAVGP
ncbi:Dyp-type peroxidase domain-containing protein [Variovorax sp. KK3]|uniref:Dyp-type peroxidase domain-containing protein n=1 Tax=Variovorax sp. KK3 TaxID=1855728 RepID=UPI00097C7196|nr:Dyp-type peroxidase domain-containing protein [Variovorax sp. KK3]